MICETYKTSKFFDLRKGIFAVFTPDVKFRLRPKEKKLLSARENRARKIKIQRVIY